MKSKMMCLTVVCLLLGAISTAQALTKYTISDTIYRQSTGGPFLMNPDDGSSSFYTFCVETGEHIGFGPQYYGTIDSVVIFGSGIKDNSDPLNLNTKRLYDYALDNWAALTSGTLKPTNGTPAEELTAIQAAIWAFQGETGAPASGSRADYYYQNVLTLNPNLDRTIMALNLWTADVSLAPYQPIIGNANAYAAKAQSQLIAVPEPGILILLGIAMSAIGAASWRIRKL